MANFAVKLTNSTTKYKADVELTESSRAQNIQSVTCGACPVARVVVAAVSSSSPVAAVPVVATHHGVAAAVAAIASAAPAAAPAATAAARAPVLFGRGLAEVDLHAADCDLADLDELPHRLLALEGDEAEALPRVLHLRHRAGQGCQVVIKAGIHTDTNSGLIH